jgi:primase-polymerase (primpol)-like protein
VWRYTPRDNDRWAKPPFDARTDRKADPSNPKTWTPFDLALRRVEDPAAYDGLGFVFAADDPFSGVDLDHCRDPAEGKVEPWAMEIVDTLNTYTEVSPSGTGLKLFGRGTLPGPGRHAGGVELYDRSHYFTVTGHSLSGCPAEVRDCQHPLTALYESLQAPKRVSQPPPLTIYEPSGVGDDDELVCRASSCP